MQPTAQAVGVNLENRQAPKERKKGSDTTRASTALTSLPNRANQRITSRVDRSEPRSRSILSVFLPERRLQHRRLLLRSPDLQRNHQQEDQQPRRLPEHQNPTRHHARSKHINRIANLRIQSAGHQLPCLGFHRKRRTQLKASYRPENESDDHQAQTRNRQSSPHRRGMLPEHGANRPTHNKS